MARVKRSIVERNAFVLLACLASLADGHPPVAIVSQRTIAGRMGISQTRVRHLMRMLAERDCIRVSHRFAEDGGELANAHYITPTGRAALQEGPERWQSVYACNTSAPRAKQQTQRS